MIVALVCLCLVRGKMRDRLRLDSALRRSSLAEWLRDMLSSFRGLRGYENKRINKRFLVDIEGFISRFEDYVILTLSPYENTTKI